MSNSFVLQPYPVMIAADMGRVVERALGRLGRFRRLARDNE